MRRIGSIVLHNLRLLASDRAALMWLLVMPVVFTVAMGMAIRGGGGDASGGPVRYGLTVANEDEGLHGDKLLDAIRASDEIDLILLEGDASGKEAVKLVEDGDRSAALVIPPGYSRAVDAGEGAVVAFHRNPERMNPLVTQQAVEDVIARLNVEARVAVGAREAYIELWGTPPAEVASRLEENAIAFVSSSWENPPLTVSEETLGRDAGAGAPRMGFTHFSPSMALMFVLLNALMGSVALVEERKNRTLARLFSTPTRRSEIIAAQMGWRFAVGVVQFWFLVALGVLLFRVDWGETMTGVLLLSVSYVAAASALAVLIGAVSRTTGQAESISLLATLTMCAMGGLWWPLEITPRGYQLIGHLIPTGWAMDGLHNLVSRGLPLPAVLPQVGWLLLFALGFGIAAVRVFRYE